MIIQKLKYGVVRRRILQQHRHEDKERFPRGIFCAIGRCTDCVMVVDGKCNTRTCITPLKEGMTVQTQVGLKAKESCDEAL